MDATNAVEHPAACVITSISLDHTDILGDTIEKIAAEKAGILKKDVPVFFDGSCKKSSDVIRKLSLIHISHTSDTTFQKRFRGCP